MTKYTKITKILFVLGDSKLFVDFFFSQGPLNINPAKREGWLYNILLSALKSFKRSLSFRISN